MGMADSCTCPVCLWRHVAHGRPCVCGGILHMPAPLPNTASFGSRRAPTALVDKHLVGGRRGGPCTFAKRGERRRRGCPARFCSRAAVLSRGTLSQLVRYRSVRAHLVRRSRIDVTRML